ncbi:hypothetical protein [Wohlfahrtiimonas larvae]|uniref:Uncharacterized protein n=1 Tax=Wohlfahrtiimonas larvae TaxID=1157986 RepID=A0ABP9MDB8_9GAMM|nr:hypothetical protein [Wohlfahrtiimonas larvae]
MDIMRREEILSSIISRQATRNDYGLRVQFEIKNGNLSNLSGALLDYFIISNAEHNMDRLDMVKDSMLQLDDDWLLFFYDHIDRKVLPCTPLPKSCKSILTEDVQGGFNSIENPYT